MTTLVTGGAGYIGSHVVQLLTRMRRPVVVLDSLEYGHRAAVRSTPFVHADIADEPRVRDTIARYGVSSVVHLAGYKAAGESITNPGRYFANNAAKTASLLDILHSCDVPHIVFSSSCAVYGTPAAVPVSEQEQIHPESPYGESKAMVERMLHWYDRCYGMRSVSLRYFNAAGASLDASIGEDWSATVNLVPLIMKALLGRRPPLQIFGGDYPTPDGTAIRDYIHVADLADAHVRALDFLKSGGETVAINLGTEVGSSVKQVISEAEQLTGRKVPFEMAPRRPGDPVALYADNTQARRVLGWEPSLDLSEMIRTAWAWHSTHLDGFADSAPALEST